MHFCLFRLAEVASKQEDKDRVKKLKPFEQIHTSLADRFSQLHDAENAWKKKVRSDVQSKLKSLAS